ncbi:MAG: helical backbone metal receptor [Candidatus Cloacimonadaceae bacterium]
MSFRIVRIAATGLLLTVILMMLFLAACTKESSAADETRYVVLSPELAEIIAVLEGTENIVGITEECTFPPSLAGKTIVGKFGTLNKEKIISLKPSIVFATSLEQQAIAAELSKLGITVFSVYPKSVSEMLEGIVSVGKAIDKEARAVFVADSLKAELEQISKNIVNEKKPKVYLEIYREPLMSVSDQSFVGELIELAGGDNIFTTLERDYSRVKAEDVIKANPEIIICYSQDSADNIRKRMGWKDIPAVKNNRIYYEKDINPDWILRAGPRCVQGARRLQELFYGELY